MSIIDKASLVLIPSGYSEGFVYPIKNPINPGRISYTRNATSTRVNSKGLIESVPYNLFGGSNSALGSTAGGGYPGTTLTANAALAPDGSYTATFVDYTTAIENSKNVEFSFNNVIFKTYTASIWIKGTAGQTINLVLDWDGSNGANVQRTLDGTWQRFSITHNYNQNITNYAIFRVGIRSMYGYSGTATQVYIWGVQLVEGTEAKDYLTTTDRLNFPTLDYSTGKPTFLFEPSVTNLNTYSESFTSATGWTLPVGITSFYSIAPDGSNTATRITAGVGGRMPYYKSTVNGVINQVYTYSIYIKSNTTNTPLRILVDQGCSNICGAKIVTATTSWQRVDVQATAQLTTSLTIVIDNIIDNTTLCTGAYGAFDISVWGAQLQTGTATTSYIPTTNASVTRAGGSTAALGSSYFGTNKGTLLLGVEGIKTLVSGTSSATVRLQSGGSLVMTLYDDGLGLGFYDYYGNAFLCTVDRTTKKMLIKWDGTTSVGFVNGVKTATLTTGSARSIDNIGGLGANLNAYNLSVFAIFPEALSDAECISLTS